ncbi:unnamed protein product [Choristocarpus tenellus]
MSFLYLSLSTVDDTSTFSHSDRSHKESADLEGIMRVTKFPRAQIFGLRSHGGRSVAGTTFKDAAEDSLCESIRAEQMIFRALQLPIEEGTLQNLMAEYHLGVSPDRRRKESTCSEDCRGMEVGKGVGRFNALLGRSSNS